MEIITHESPNTYFSALQFIINLAIIIGYINFNDLI